MPKHKVGLYKYIKSKKKNMYSKGGNLKNEPFANFNQYNVGGLHETNPYGGIPVGMGSNGLPNTVEQGETSFDFDDGTYIFSDRLGFDITPNIGSMMDDNMFLNGGPLDPPNEENPRLPSKKVPHPRSDEGRRLKAELKRKKSRVYGQYVPLKRKTKIQEDDSAKLIRRAIIKRSKSNKMMGGGMSKVMNYMSKKY